MSKKYDRSEMPITVTATASQWLHLLMVSASGRQTLVECEGPLLTAKHVRGQLREIDAALAAISRGMQAADELDRRQDIDG